MTDDRSRGTRFKLRTVPQIRGAGRSAADEGEKLGALLIAEHPREKRREAQREGRGEGISEHVRGQGSGRLQWADRSPENICPK